VPVLGDVPLDLPLREGGDSGTPIVLSAPDSPAGQVLTSVASTLSGRGRGLAGLQLGLSPAGR
jgi:ATP-binding protein involved in chromosome partitioning